MLQIIFAIVYITLVCWSWGQSALSLLNRFTAESYAASLPITCLFGLTLIGISSQILSVFIPVGGWQVQVFLLCPPALFLFRQPSIFRSQYLALLKTIQAFKVPSFYFLGIGLLFILVIGAWHLINPDTLGYHAPIIEWNKKLSLVPGIANINGRLGLQSSWFILCALFSFSFTGTPALTFINLAILSWLVLFLAEQLNRNFKSLHATNQSQVLWCIICFFCFGVNVQVYLTASSASPDFVICLFLWTCFYLLLYPDDEQNSATRVIVALTILAFSVTLKLSAIPSLLILPFFYRQLGKIKPLKRIILLGIIPAIAIIPFLFRNIIITGYPLFPALYFDFFNVDWKTDPDMARQIDEYVTVYAKVGYVTISNYMPAADFPISKWFPLWLEQYTAAEKFLVFTAVLAAIGNLFFIKQFFERKNRSLALILAVCFISSILLMVKAPAPRFAQAFLIPVILAFAFVLLEKFPGLLYPRWLTKPIVFVLLFALTGYCCYRFYRFFEPVNFWKPYGISAKPLNTVDCNGLKVNIPLDPFGCGGSPLPCANNPCEVFEPRGKTLEEGFRAIIPTTDR